MKSDAVNDEDVDGGRQTTKVPRHIPPHDVHNFRKEIK